MTNVINVATLAGYALIGMAAVGFVFQLVGAVVGHPLDAVTVGNIQDLIKYVIGIAVGTGLGTVITLKAMGKLE